MGNRFILDTLRGNVWFDSYDRAWLPEHMDDTHLANTVALVERRAAELHAMHAVLSLLTEAPGDSNDAQGRMHDLHYRGDWFNRVRDEVRLAPLAWLYKYSPLYRQMKSELKRRQFCLDRIKAEIPTNARTVSDFDRAHELLRRAVVGGASPAEVANLALSVTGQESDIKAFRQEFFEQLQEVVQWMRQ